MIDKISFAWLTLQRAVNAIVDSDLDKLSMEKNRGVKQVILLDYKLIFLQFYVLFYMIRY